ncbi:MAG: acyl-CoA synthetase FdrA [Halanaerobiales bacterium]|nr:acyl-CoA synthetase FdrA [Halanaerobiales bacterium]
MAKKALIKEGTYFDSVTLMSISKELKKIDGVTEATVIMGTDANKGILETAGLLLPEAESADPSDLILVIDGKEEVIEEAFEQANKLLDEKKSSSGEQEDYKPGSLDGALELQPDSNLVIISVPGDYAAREARKALNRGLHVMLFSDNVSVEDEIALKELATEKGLLLMGPDCGTSIINGAPLAFANVVNRGPVGIVAAAGTGAQAVSTLVDRQGVGLSQVIGLGGRDLKSKVKGREMIKDMKALDNDDMTEVIVLVSKPPAKEVSEKIMEEVKKLNKPVVVNFLGGDPSVVEGTDAVWADTLEAAAVKAVALVKGDNEENNLQLTDEEISKLAKEETANMNDKQKYLRGLYGGGTLNSEAVVLLSDMIGDIYSNAPLKKELALKEDLKSIKNTIIDLGEDEFTRGKPHPMIEPSLRNERLLQEVKDEEVAVVLIDVVLGYGSHSDPAGVAAEGIKEAKEIVAARGGYLSVIASVCGTENDPQNLQAQEEKLRQVGAKVLPTNVQAVRVVSKIISDLN